MLRHNFGRPKFGCFHRCCAPVWERKPLDATILNRDFTSNKTILYMEK